MVFCGALLASSHDARALSIGDSHELGFIWPGVQKKTDHQNKVIYLNHLIGMALGTIDIANGEVYFRANNVFESLPAAGRAHHAEPIKGENRELVNPELGIYRFDDLIVLKSAAMPAALLECGVIVNRSEESRAANRPATAESGGRRQRRGDRNVRYDEARLSD
jgi:hypothetical protein